MIGYNLLLKTKMEFLITDYISHYFQIQLLRRLLYKSISPK